MTEIVISPSLPKWVLGTFEGKLIASWIGYSEVEAGMIEFAGDAEITAMRMEAMIPSEGTEGGRMPGVDDLMHSLIAKFPDQIPYAEVTRARGCTFITPEGIEWFDMAALLQARREEFLDKQAPVLPMS